MANEIANVDKYSVMSMDSKELMEVIKENLGGEQLSPSDLDRVKIPSGGGTSFEVPTLEGEVDAKELVGIVIFWKSTRAYWEGEYTGESNPPDCYSDDGETGVGNPGGDCASCPLAQFGSSTKGSKTGQACKQMRLFFLTQEDSLLPLVVTLPPTSLKNGKQYFLRLASKGIPYYGVTTKFMLVKDKNADGIVYSKATLSVADKLSPEQLTKVRAYAEAIRPALARVRVDAAEDYKEVSEDEEYPNA